MADDVGYTEGAPWSGQKRWVCDDPACGFDSLNEDAMRAHVEEYHMVKTQIVDTGLVDSRGNPITVEKPITRN